MTALALVPFADHVEGCAAAREWTVQNAHAAAVNRDDQPKYDEAAVRRGFWRKLGRFAAQIPFAEELLTAYYCAFDRHTPTHVRVVLLGAIAYFVAPVDMLPDVLPIVGLTDDAAVVAGTVKVIWDHIKPLHREAAREALARLGTEPKG